MMLKQILFSLIIMSGTAYSMDNTSKKNKKRKRNQMVNNIVENKRVKTQGKVEHVLNSICPKCDKDWLAQTDECPRCGEPTGLGVGYDVINHRYFFPENNNK